MWFYQRAGDLADALHFVSAVYLALAHSLGLFLKRYWLVFRSPTRMTFAGVFIPPWLANKTSVPSVFLRSALPRFSVLPLDPGPQSISFCFEVR